MKKAIIGLVLAFLLMGIVALASYVKVVRGAYYYYFAITVTPESPTTYDSINSTVSFEVAYSHYRVNFGQVSRTGNVFSITININVPPTIGLPVLIPRSQTYQLGKLANGSYSFHADVQVWDNETGSLLEFAFYEKSFTVGTGGVFDITWGFGIGPYNVTILCDHDITSFDFSKSGKMNFTLMADDSGSCNVTIPRSRLDAPFEVTIDGITTSWITKQNETDSTLSFTYATGVHPVEITGTERGYIIGDINHDGKVDILDITIVAKNFHNKEEDFP